jgi:hypothetical protein
MVTPRSLRRSLHRRNPNAAKVAAGFMATAVGMTTAAFGVLHMTTPFKGNGARTDTWDSSQNAGPIDGGLMNILSLIPITPTTPDGGALGFTLPDSATVTTPVIELADSVTGGNGSNSPVTPGDPQGPSSILPNIGSIGGPGLNRPGSGGGSTDPGDGSDPTLNITPPDTSAALCTVAPLTPAIDPSVVPTPTASSDSSTDSSASSDDSADPCAPEGSDPAAGSSDSSSAPSDGSTADSGTGSGSDQPTA